MKGTELRYTDQVDSMLIDDGASQMAPMVSICQCRREKRCGFIPWVRKRHGNPFQYSCLENPHGQRSLVGYSPWGLTELDTTEAT